VASRSQALEGEPLHDLAALFSEANLWKGQYAKVLAGLKAGPQKQQALSFAAAATAAAAESSAGAADDSGQGKATL